MIQTAKYNGVDFTENFSRVGKYSFDLQRKKNYVTDGQVLSFFSDYPSFLNPINELNVATSMVNAYHIQEVEGGNIYYFAVPTIPERKNNFYLSVKIGDETIFSEICDYIPSNILQGSGIATVTAGNSNSKNGFIDYGGFSANFEYSEFKGDVFINKSIVYDYSFSRKKILDSENQIAKRITFHNLSMFQQNILKWLCNCEVLAIDSVEYQLITELTEMLANENSEIVDLQGTFIEVEQSFFRKASTKEPKELNATQFFTN